MADNNNFQSTVESLFKGLDSFLTTKTVVGEPIHIGENILRPLADVSFGVAAGAFASSAKNNGGGGMGAKITPSAILVINKNGTRLVNVKNQDVVTKILDMIPDIAAQMCIRDRRDRKGAQFPVACRCNSCYNIIYNSLPSCLLDEARAVKRTGCRLFRMNFTVENGRETEQAARQFAAVWISGEKPPAEEKRVRGTRGHYRRGVE